MISHDSVWTIQRFTYDSESIVLGSQVGAVLVVANGLT